MRGNDRLAGIDLFRIICTIGVIWLHIHRDIPFHNSLAFIGSMSVSCFIMMSGSLVLTDDRWIPVGKWYRKTFRKLVIPWMLSWILYIAENAVLSIKNTGYYSLMDDLMSIVNKGYPIRGWHLWFMHTITILYLLVPLLKWIKSRAYFLYYMLIPLTFIIGQFAGHCIWPLTFIQLIWLFLMGDFISVVCADMHIRTRYIICLIAAIAVISGMICAYKGMQCPYSSLLIILMMIAFYCALIRANLYPVSKHLFGIYILHVAVGDLLSGIEIHFGLDKANLWWRIIPESLIIFITALIIVALADRCYSRIARLRRLR